VLDTLSAPYYFVHDAFYDRLHIDYLKIEVEGVEIEILEAALADWMEIEEIAIDASAERDDNEVVDKISAIIESYNYDWQINEETLEWGFRDYLRKTRNLVNNGIGSYTLMKQFNYLSFITEILLTNRS